MLRSEKTKTVSGHVKTRAAKMSGEQIGPGEFRVTPEAGKKIRTVQFHMYGDGVSIDCFEEDTLISCPANAHARHCSHVEFAIQLLLAAEEK